MQANSKNFKTISAKYSVIVGGFHKDKGYTSIGRIHIRGATAVGKIDSWYDPAILYVISGGLIVKAETYEIMVYQKAKHEKDPRCISQKASFDSFCCAHSTNKA